MHPGNKRLLSLSAMCFGLALPAMANAAEDDILIEALSPRQGAQGESPIEPLSGWPLVLRFSIEGDLFMRFAGKDGSPFPVTGETGFLARADPACIQSCTDLEFADCDCYTDLLEFTPDVDLPGVHDYAGNEKSRQEMSTIFPLNRRPPFEYKDRSSGYYFLAPIGPLTVAPTFFGDVNSCVIDSDVMDDGFGFGADDDLPGLVLLSDTGVGVALDQVFNRIDPPVAHNLAGFFNSVSYELNDAAGRTIVLASMVVPERLFIPLILVDSCIRESSLDGDTCPDGFSIWQIDGGPKLSVGYLDVNRDSLDLVKVVTLRAFMVRGKAPSYIEDLNRDDIVDIEDAQAGGLELLSNQVVITFVQELACSGGPSDGCPVIPFDFDKSGKTGYDTGLQECFRFNIDCADCITPQGPFRAGPRVTRIRR